MAAWKLLCLFLVLVVTAEALPSNRKRDTMEAVPFLSSASLAKAFLTREPLAERGAKENLSRWGGAIKSQFSEWGSDIKHGWRRLKSKFGKSSTTRREPAIDVLGQ